jgi:hypothetical protein
MSARRLHFSERKLLAETGSLGDLIEFPSMELRRALVHVVQRARTAGLGWLGKAFAERAQDVCEEHFGWDKEEVGTYPLYAATSEDLLDYAEILVDVGTTPTRYSVGGRTQSASAWPNAERDLNRLFERHRFGFRIQNGEAHAIASPALDDAVVGPALLALSEPGWQEAERSFREALLHQRGPASENDDALTAANAALEAALKAMGLRGTTLGDLGKSLRASHYVPGHLAGVPKMLDDLLQRSNAIRSTEGDAHGKAPGAEDVPQSLVNLAIHLAGAFIVYLAEVKREVDGG